MIKMSDQLILQGKFISLVQIVELNILRKPNKLGKKVSARPAEKKIVAPQSDENNLLSEYYAGSETQSNSLPETVSSIFTIPVCVSSRPLFPLTKLLLFYIFQNYS